LGLGSTLVVALGAVLLMYPILHTTTTYDQIAQGMTIEEVECILGPSDVGIGSSSWSSYRWETMTGEIWVDFRIDENMKEVVVKKNINTSKRLSILQYLAKYCRR
jgi:predicted class III extradiol MEMO1 family dioxygenase